MEKELSGKGRRLRTHERLQLARTRLELSQAALGDYLGVSRETVRRAEIGRVPLRNGWLWAFMILRVSPVWLLTGKGRARRPPIAFDLSERALLETFVPIPEYAKSDPV